MTAWKQQHHKQKYIVKGNQKNSKKIVNNTDITVLSNSSYPIADS